MNHEERKQKADEMANPSFYFSYVLELEDGALYVGSTNSPAARWTEHAVGIGAKATQGQSFKVRMVMPFVSRREAEYNEQRLQVALQTGGPQGLTALLSLYDQIINIVRPQKTLRELEVEQRDFDREIRRNFHFVTNLRSMHLTKKTACGAEGDVVGEMTSVGQGQFTGTDDWGELLQRQREKEAIESVNGKFRDRRPCPACLAMAPDAAPVGG